MKVTHIALGFPPDKGGIEYHVENLAKYLAKNGVQIRIMVPLREGYAYYGQYEDFREVVRLSSTFRFRKLFFTPNLLGLLMKEAPDIYHLHMPYYIGSEMTWLASMLRRRPLVVTYHSDYYGSVGFLRPLEGLYNKTFINYMLARAKRIIVTSWSYLVNSRICRPLWNKCVVIPYGIDHQKFRPNVDSHSIRRFYGIGDNELLVLFVASLERGHIQKGLTYLLDAIKLAGDVIPDLRLMVVGDGELRPLYQQYAKSIKIMDKVVWAGAVENRFLPEYYADSDIFVLPSTNRLESFGIVFLEAMACEKPVICSDLPGVRDKVITHKAGVVVPPKAPSLLKDALVRLAQDEYLRRSMGERGRQAVERNFTNQLVAEKTMRLYEECISTH